MSALLCSGWFPYLLAFVVGLATAYWAWSRREPAAPAVESKVAPQPLPAPAATSAVAAPKVSAAPVVAAAATAAVAVPLMAAKKPKAKAAAKPKAKAAPKPKAAAAPVKATAAPKPKAAPAPKAAVAPKAKVAAAPKAKATAAPKAAVPKAKAAVKPVALKAAPAPKAKAAPKPKAAAKPKPAPKPVIPDNLELLKGVGPKLNTLLKSLGVSTFEQVANWSPSDVREIDSKLGAFAGRISRDNWIDQAKLLLKGDVAGFEKKYGSLGSEINRG
jgi:predicted flap endonuclease-1-like 5' DNA nuclease